MSSVVENFLLAGPKQVAVAAFGMMLLGSSAVAAPIVAGSYYEDNVTLSCAVAPCTALFSAVPAGQRVLVTNISCSIIVTSSSLYFAELTVGAGHTIRREILQVGPARPEGVSNNVYTAGGEVKFLFSPTQRPRVSAYLTTDASSVLICRIVGTRPAPI